MLQRACDDLALREWLSPDHDTPTMGTAEVQAVFDLLYALRDEVSRVTGVACHRAWTRSTRMDKRRRRHLCPGSSRITRPSRSEPMSCGTGMRRE